MYFGMLIPNNLKKKKVKAEQREARKVKVPKALKKKKKKIAKAKGTKR